MVSGSCVCMVYVNSVVTGRRYGTLATGMVIVHGFVYIMGECSRGPNCVCVVPLATFLLICPENYHSNKSVVSVLYSVHVYDFFEMMYGSCASMVNVNSVVTGRRYVTLATGMVIVHRFV